MIFVILHIQASLIFLCEYVKLKKNHLYLSVSNDL